MKAISYIAFLFSLMVIMAHDLVPHVHENEMGMFEEPLSVPGTSTNNGETSLSHLLGHLKHNTSEHTLVSNVSVEKKIEFDFGTDLLIPSVPETAPGWIWYSNLKKQRLWDNQNFLQQFVLHAYPHRGPPAAAQA